MSLPLLSTSHPALLNLHSCLPVLSQLTRQLARRSPAWQRAFSAQPEPEELTVTVNGRTVHVPRGATLYDATQKLGAFVPILCKHPRLPITPGACRVCMVEADGRVRPACCTPAWEGATINTDTPEVQGVIRGTLQLLRANHPEDCMTCDVNGACEFQDLISRYKVPLMPKLRQVSQDYQEHTADWNWQDTSSLALRLDREKCIKCSRCVTTCAEVQGMNVLGMFARGRERHIGFVYETDMDLSKCISCGQCVSVCPVGALSERTEWRQVLEQLATKRKVMVVQTAPATRVAIGEELGFKPGAVTTGQMVAGLKALGFDYVFDTNFSADLTIMEEGTELIHRLKAAWGLEQQPQGSSAGSSTGGQQQHGVAPLPMFTSCCPAWVQLVEKDFPELIPHLSTAKSPQQMLGPVIKEVWAPASGLKPSDVVVVSIMPCTAKKLEAERPEFETAGVRHVDYVLTTRELGRLFRQQKVQMASLPEAAYDDPMGVGSGAAQLFGNTGGVMEAAVRTAAELLTGKELPRVNLDAVRGLEGVKEATLELQLAGTNLTKQVRVAVVNGIGNVRRLLERVRDGTAPYDFIEVMTCQGGCIGGGGQPKYRGEGVLEARMGSVYSIDEAATLRKSHENPQIKELYARHLHAPGDHLAHELLHTTYTDRHSQLTPSYTAAEKAQATLPEEVAAAKVAEARIPGPPVPQQGKVAAGTQR